MLCRHAPQPPGGDEDADGEEEPPPETVVSCSWDSTVRVWSLVQTGGAPDVVALATLRMPDSSEPFRSGQSRVHLAFQLQCVGCSLS